MNTENHLKSFAFHLAYININFLSFFFLPSSLQILRTLYQTYVNMKQKPIWNDLNPKAVTTDELFGFIHHTTREWKDGK